jgi:hypothetical protein
MNNNRFKMSFNNVVSNPPIFGNPRPNNLGTIRPSVSQNLPLNSPMIDRVHKAKPGCSVCGKKVA